MYTHKQMHMPMHTQTDTNLFFEVLISVSLKKKSAIFGLGLGQNFQQFLKCPQAMSSEAFHLPTAADSHQGLDQSQLPAVSIQCVIQTCLYGLPRPKFTITSRSRGPVERQDHSGPQDEDVREEPAASAQHPSVHLSLGLECLP